MRLQEFQDRIDKLQIDYESLNQKDRKFNVLRLIYFLIGVALVIFLSTLNWYLPLIVGILFLISFSRLIRYHNSIIYEKNLTTELIELNKNELRSLQNDHSAFSSGLRFEDPLHPFSLDMDIFGDASLFQLLSRCNTSFGEDRLAKILLHRLEADEIQEHQEAIQELEDSNEWCQMLYAIGKVDLDQIHTDEHLRTWIRSERLLPDNFMMTYACIALSWILFIILLFYLPWGTAIIGFIPNVLLTHRYSKQIGSIHALLDKYEKQIRPYSNIIKYIEAEKFTSPKLKSLQAQLLIGDKSASKNLLTLAGFLKQLDIRTNFFGFLFSYLLCWDTLFAQKVEQWKEVHRDDLFDWLETLGYFEYLSSMANFGYKYHKYVYPTVHQDKEFTSEQLGHPLLHAEQRISNDFGMPTHKHIKIVTGSNMGGKSTFLRTIGINMILAYAGARVCAKSLSLPYLQLISSMRTQDALNENTSSFYAELKRLKMVIDSVKVNNNIFFLLDEILKGTNSNDRHNGAKAMINQLLNENGAGLISTHDLELGKMIDQHPDTIDNICFEVDVDGDQLVFDYKIKQGISKSFNATHLMRNIGIDI